MSSEELAGDVSGTEWLLELLEELGQQIKGHCRQEPRMYSRKGSSQWTMAASCPWRDEHRDGSGAELGAQPSYPRPRNPEQEHKARQGAERGGQRQGGCRPHGLPLTPLLGAPALPHPVALPKHLAPSAPPPQMTECLQELDGRPRALREAWALHWERCEGSWRLQKLQQWLDQAEAWLACREDLLLDPNCRVSRGPAP